MKLQAILNKGDGVYLEMAHIISLGINEIPVDHNGNTAFAILAYPSPGAGYKLALYNDEAKAQDEFSKLVGTIISGGSDGTTYSIESDFKAPVVDTEVPVIGQADVTTIGEGEAADINGVRYEVSEEGDLSITNLGDNSVTVEGIGENGEINIHAEVETQVAEAVEEVNEEVGGPVFG